MLCLQSLFVTIMYLSYIIEMKSTRLRKKIVGSLKDIQPLTCVLRKYTRSTNVPNIKDMYSSGTVYTELT